MDDEIDLRQYLTVLWKRRYAIGLIALGGVLIAGVLSFILPPLYEARALVLVAKPLYQIGAPPDPQVPGPKIGTVLVSELPTETLVAFAKSEAIKRRIASRSFGGISSNRRISETLTAQALRNTNLVELKVKGSDQKRVAAIANEWAALVSLESEALFSTQAQQSYAFFDRRLKGAKGGLDVAEIAIRRFQGSSNISVYEARLNPATSQIAGYRGRMTDLSVDLMKSETELASVEAQIRRQPRMLTLAKSITTDPFLHQAASEAAKRDFVELSRLKLTNQELNPVYLNLDQTRAQLVIRVATLKAERGGITRAMAELAHEVADLRDQLAREQLVQTQLVRAVDNAKQVYDVLLQRREEASVASAIQTGSAKLVAEAVVPESPVAPQKAPYILFGGVLGLIAGTIMIFAIEHLRIPTARTASPQTTPVANPSHRS